MTKLEALTSEDLERFMQENGIDGDMLHLDAPTPTVEAAAEVVGATVEQIVKTLLFIVDGNPVVAVASGTLPVERRVLARHFDVGRKRVKLADPDQVLEYAGYPVGTVPPFGHRLAMPAFLDERVLQHETVFAGGGGMNALVRLASNTIKETISPVVIDLISLTE